MRIVIKDSKTGKEYLIVGHNEIEFEIFKRSEGKLVDGVRKGEGEWTSCRNYPTTLPSAVYKCISWLLGNPEDDEEICVEADKVRIKLGKVLKDRVDQIVAEVQDA